MPAARRCRSAAPLSLCPQGSWASPEKRKPPRRGSSGGRGQAAEAPGVRTGGVVWGEEVPIAHFCDVSRTIQNQRHAVKKIFLGILASFFAFRSPWQAARSLVIPAKAGIQGRGPRSRGMRFPYPGRASPPPDRGQKRREREGNAGVLRRINCLSSRRKLGPVHAGVRASATARRRGRPPSPLRGGSQNPEDAVQNTPVIDARDATRFARKDWLDGLPVGFVARVARCKAPFRSLNHEAIIYRKPTA